MRIAIQKEQELTEYTMLFIFLKAVGINLSLSPTPPRSWISQKSFKTDTQLNNSSAFPSKR